MKREAKGKISERTSFNQSEGPRDTLHALRVTICAVSLFISVGGVGLALPDSDKPSEWFERARADLRVAEVIFLEQVDPPSVCFHAHQAVEKLLKGLMIQHGVTPPRNHYTAEFVGQLARFEPKIEMMQDAAVKLDRIYIPSRYPKFSNPA